MLTIDEIKNISFRKATLSGGYRAEDVDSFIDEVIASVGATDIKQMGAVIKGVGAKCGARADMGQVSKIVKEKLSA